jgi:hypothetical protein
VESGDQAGGAGLERFPALRRFSAGPLKQIGTLSLGVGTRLWGYHSVELRLLIDFRQQSLA